MTNPTSFAQLQNYYDSFKHKTLVDLFQEDPTRGERFSIKAHNVFLDYSKNYIDDSVMDGLFALARSRNLSAKIAAMHRGEKINFTENRAVGHMALRSKEPFIIDGVDYREHIDGVLHKIKEFSAAIRSGAKKGYSGRKFESVIHIGIGGSSLGVEMIYNALGGHKKDFNCYFVANIDGEDLKRALNAVDLETTLFVVASKTFTTQETIVNARLARDFLVKHYGGDKKSTEAHFVALSTNEQQVSDFGIDTNNMFGFWDFVGGRFSSMSAIGITIAIAYGYDVFDELLAGARDIDKHFISEDFKNNIPVILGLLGVWYRNFYNMSTIALMPYSYFLRDFTQYLQQLDMESNGKSTNSCGEKIAYSSGPIVFGEAGTNSQHSYFQLIHQGTDIIPADFIGAIHSSACQTDARFKHHNDILLSNLLAQTRALMVGKDIQTLTDEMQAGGFSDEQIKRVAQHRVFEGNRPTNTILVDEINARSVGALMAIYEHKIFVQGVIWDVNSFDQWGVELGKQLASGLLQSIEKGESYGYDSSTNNLLAKIKQGQI